MDQGINIAGVQFRRAGKIYDFRYNELELTVGDHVVVDTEKGSSLARVVMLKFETESKNAERELKSVLRKAGRKELEKKPKIDLDEVISYTKDRVTKLKLDMNVLTAEIQFGGSKITVFFTAPGRVDFRELVKDLAAGLKARVELKQVGARDETKLVGGVGICGREFCCSSFLREFVPVSIKMAKNQNLALNPSKVSGGCGRLLCCLTYEDDTYSALRKTLPGRGTKVFIPETGGYGSVVKSDILNQEVLVENERGQLETFGVEDINIVDKHQKGSAGKDSADSWGDDLDLEALSAFAESDGKSDSKKPGNRRDGHGPRNNRDRPQRNSKEQGRGPDNRGNKPRNNNNKNKSSNSRNNEQRDGQNPQQNSRPSDGSGEQGKPKNKKRRNRNRNKKKTSE